MFLFKTGLGEISNFLVMTGAGEWSLTDVVFFKSVTILAGAVLGTSLITVVVVVVVVVAFLEASV